MRAHEEPGGQMFAVFGGFSAEETTKTSKHRTTGMNSPSGLRVFF